jgi:hypothetical protein
MSEPARSSDAEEAPEADTQSTQTSSETTQADAAEAGSLTPTKLIESPTVSLEDVTGNVPTCDGRGRSTAAVRGYNSERLAYAVFDSSSIFIAVSSHPFYDTYAKGDQDVSVRVECKSCVHRYPKGQYGRFRIWKTHHDKFQETAETWHEDEAKFLYLFVVYTVEDEKPREVGKLTAPVATIDAVLDKWRSQDHPTMGTQPARDISWHLLLKRLGVPKETFVDQPIVDLTNGLPDTESTETE